MDITIAGRHVAVTDAMRDHARALAERMGKYGPHLMHVKVTLAIEGDRKIAEFVGAVRAKKTELVAKVESHDMYVALDSAAAKIERQLEKMEGRFKTRRPSGVYRRPVGEKAEPAEAEAEEEEIEPEEGAAL